MKNYADNKRNASECKLKMGDAVLARQEKKNKLSSIFDPVPFKITAIKGSMITATRSSKTITRNSSFFKQVKSGDTTQTASTTNEEDYDDDDYDHALVVPPGERQHNVPQPGHPVQLPYAADTGQRRNPIRSRLRPTRFKDYV